MNKEFGKCTDDRNGEIVLDSTTGASYFCDNGKWILDEDTEVYLDTLADGSYQCTDTTSAGNYAKITVADSELAYSGHIDYSTSIFSSRPFSYLQSDTLYSRFVAGRDYDFALQCNSEVFMISDAALGSFIYKHYSISGDSLIVMRCKDASYVTTQNSWTSPFNTSVTYGSFTDSRDNKEYKTVTIDSITWMAQNLNYDTEGSYCYAGKASNCSRYGRLYSWAMVMNGASASGLVPSGERGLCPDGWHVPSAAEWDALKSYADSLTDGMGAFSIRSIFNWTVYSSKYDSLNYMGTDLFGFSAVAGGYEDSVGFSELGETATWWTASEYNSSHAMNRDIFYDSKWMGTGHTSKGDLRSLRCVEDYDTDIPFNTSIKYGKLTDARDDQTYRTVTIGERTWMAENLNYEVESSSCYNDDIHYCSRYGRLYTWVAAMNPPPGLVESSNREPSGIQGICPSGWHLPSIAEWKTLQANLADTVSATAGLSLKALGGWTDSTGGIAGTDLYGFRALPGGQGYERVYRSYTDIGRRGLWWTTVENGFAYAFSLQDSTSAISFQASELRGTLVSVRCVEDYLSRLDSLLGECTEAKRNAVITRDGKSYYCDPYGWRSASSAEVVNFEAARSAGACTEALQDSVSIIGSLAYTCDSLFWRLSTDAEMLNYRLSRTFGPCTAALEDSVRMRDSDSLYYICSSLSWRQATDAEIFNYSLFQTFGLCTAALQDSVKEDSTGVYYTCDSLSWRTSTAAESSNHVASQEFGQCTAALKSTVDTAAATGVAYICDSTTFSWRAATALEEDIYARGACTTTREGEEYEGSAGKYWCLSRSWSLYLPGTFTDTRDSRVYRTTTIGSQTWLAENLNYDPSLDVTLADSLQLSFCYGSGEDHCLVYGRLYSWNVAMAGASSSARSPSGVQGVCPAGWHLPSDAEWATLVDYVDEVNGTHGVAASLKADTNWNYSPGYEGLDEFGFSALGGASGYLSEYSAFGTPSLTFLLSVYGYWWTSTLSSTPYGYFYAMEYSSDEVALSMTTQDWFVSVRCVEDSE